MSRVRHKNCDRCQANASILYRVRFDRSGQWQFVCADCWSIVSRDNADYVYGGTWKARKK